MSEDNEIPKFINTTAGDSIMPNTIMVPRGYRVSMIKIDGRDTMLVEPEINEDQHDNIFGAGFLTGSFLTLVGIFGIYLLW